MRPGVHVDALDERSEGTGHAMLLEVADDEGTAMRLCSVLGASAALTHHLVRHPEQWRELTDPTLGSTRPAAYAVREAMLRAVGADPHADEPVAGLPDAEAVDALRVEYRRFLLRLASRDLAHHLGIDDAAAEISDLAAATLDAALAIARARVGETAHAARLAVIAMGKCGGHELNYISDVDVVYVYEPGVLASGERAEDGLALRVATQLASHLMRICSDHTREGTIWPVDANLRPEGSQGPLVRTLASHRGYYEKWAKTWEFQALLKARPVAGDVELGQAYLEVIEPMVWSAAERDGFVADTQAMRRRVIDHIPAHEAERQLKLGSGGLRDVEFAVQLLQLVHGRADPSLREGATLSALTRLTDGGYVGRKDGEKLHEAYAFLRTLEHRIQLHQLRRTHVLPNDEASLRRLGRCQGAGGGVRPDEARRRIVDRHLVFPVGRHQAAGGQQQQYQEAGHHGQRGHGDAVGAQAAPGQRPQAGRCGMDRHGRRRIHVSCTRGSTAWYSRSASRLNTMVAAAT